MKLIRNVSMKLFCFILGLQITSFFMSFISLEYCCTVRVVVRVTNAVDYHAMINNLLHNCVNNLFLTKIKYFFHLFPLVTFTIFICSLISPVVLLFVPEKK